MATIFPETAARLAEWQTQPEVQGVLLVGSKSLPYADSLSDDDLEVYMSPEAFAAIPPVGCSELLIQGEGNEQHLVYDAQYTTFADLEHKRSSPYDLYHWPYEQATLLFDRVGQLQTLVEATRRLEPDFRRLRLLHATVDTWTAVGRAPKAFKRGFPASGQLLVNRGARALARLLFALEWRWVPMDHWLEAALSSLSDPTHAGVQLLTALRTNDPAPLRAALDGLEDRLYAEGVPRPAQRINLFLELIHTSRAEERDRHALY